MDIDIQTILDDLKAGKAKRTRDSLDHLNKTLEAHYQSGARDYSITNIGRVSAEAGGVGYDSIRATRNEHFRRLIEAWAAKADTTTKKPVGANSRSKRIPTDNKLLERITDPAVRAVFGGIIAERNRYRNEVNILKQHAQVTIDKRPVRQYDAQAESGVEVLPSLTGVLNSMEVKALEFAASDECMERQGWQTTKAGQVKSEEDNVEIFPRGFITAIRKVLGEVNNA